MSVEAAGGTGDLTPELLEAPYWSDAMVQAARHTDRRRPVRLRRRRHRVLRHRRLPAHRGRTGVPDPGFVQYRLSLADVRVPDPRLADPAHGADPLRLLLAPRQHLGLPVVRAGGGVAGQEPRATCCTCSSSRSSPTTGRRGPAPSSTQPGAGVRPGSATPTCSSRAWSAWCGAGSAAGTSRSSPRPRARRRPSASPTGPASCTSPSATRACGSCPTCRRSARPPATTSTWSTPTSRTSTSTSSSRRAPAPCCVRGGGHRRLPGVAAALRRPGTPRRPDQDRAHLPHVHQRRPRSRTSGCAAGAATAGRTRASTTRSRCGAASSRRRCASSRATTRAQQVQGHGRHEHPEAPALAAPDGRRPARGLLPRRCRARSSA